MVYLNYLWPFVSWSVCVLSVIPSGHTQHCSAMSCHRVSYRRVLLNLYDADGFCRAKPGVKQAAVRQPIRLVWDMSGDLEVKVQRALTISEQV